MAPQDEEGENVVWPQALLGSDSSHSRMENLLMKTSMIGGSTRGVGKAETPPSQSGSHSKDQPLPTPMNSKNKTIPTTQWNPLKHSVIQTEAKPLLCIMLNTSAPTWHTHHQEDGRDWIHWKAVRLEVWCDNYILSFTKDSLFHTTVPPPTREHKSQILDIGLGYMTHTGQ